MKDKPASSDSLRPDSEYSFLEYNFGQPIATNGQDIIVMKKVNGDSYSLKNWINKFYNDREKTENITKQDAQNFLQDIEKIAQFPISSYVHLAKEVACLSEHNIKMDNINPNNMLIDEENKEINHIDLMDRRERFENIGVSLNTVHDMINVLCDSLLNSRYLDVLNESDARRLAEASKAVMKKCKIAGAMTGLEDGNINTYRTYDIVDKTVRIPKGKEPVFLDSYKEFLGRYGDTINII